MAEKERDYYFDNLKAVLIFLVVLGHMLLRVSGNDTIDAIKRVIYVFHMPLFIFVSGYFAKSIYKNGQYRWKKVLGLLKSYVMFEIAIFIVYTFLGRKTLLDINLFYPDGAPWYLLAMAIWYLTIPLFRRLPAKWGIAISLAISLISGYFDFIGDFMAIARILTFAPFFYMGYYLDAETLKRILNSKYKYLITALGLVLAGIVIAFHHPLHVVLRLIYGNIPYSYLGEGMPYGILVRAGIMLAAIIMSLSIMFYVPSEKRFYSKAGANTMGIYILHRLTRDALYLAGAYGLIAGAAWYVILPVMIVVSVLLIILFGNDPVNKIVRKVF